VSKQEKPFPMPGTRWQWAGTDLSPATGPHTVRALRVSPTGNAIVDFEVESGANVATLMLCDLWVYLGGASVEVARDVVYRVRLADGRYVEDRDDHEPTEDYHGAFAMRQRGLTAEHLLHRYPGAKVVRVTRTLRRRVTL